MEKKLFTACYPVVEGQVLLGRKKRSFAAGKWNGFGGKPEAEDCTIFDTAHRELEEEAGITCPWMRLIGLLTFRFQDGSPYKDVVMFRSDGIVGAPQETDEMRPQWFDMDVLPFDDMLEGDRDWFPLFRARQPFIVSYVCSEPDVVVSYRVRAATIVEVEALLPPPFFP